MKTILSSLFCMFILEMNCFGQPTQIGLTISEPKVLDFAREEINLFLELEIVTSKTIGYGLPKKESELKNLLEPLFGEDIMKDPVLNEQYLSGRTGIADVSANIGHNIKALRAIDDALLRTRGIKGCLGLYIVIPEYLESSYHLLRTYAPDIDYAVLPAHGGRRAVLNLPYANMNKNEWRKTTVYSWLKFDGSMYIQQNGIRGIRNLMEYGDDVDWYVTCNLFNVGFCAVGIWGRTGFGNFGRKKVVHLIQAREMYEQALKYFRECALGVSAAHGKELIAFLDNRIRATIVYLKAYEKGAQIQNFDKKNLTPEQRKAVAKYCDEAILGFEQYLSLHDEMMPDRGCEGTLISAYYTPIPVLRRIRLEFGDIPYDTAPVTKKNMEAPPVPVKFKHIT